jgi:preprotein translocase subunit SecB
MNPLNLSTPYTIFRIYLKGASVEVPHMADLPQQAISPTIGVDMHTDAAPAWPGALECVLRVSLHARLEGRNVFMIEVSVAGIFELDLTDMQEANRFVRKIAPAVLFPFARKDLASLAVAAGFQPVLLDHVDFDSMLTQVIKSQRMTLMPAPKHSQVISQNDPPASAPASPPAKKPPESPQERPAETVRPKSRAEPRISALQPLGPRTRPLPGLDSQPNSRTSKGLNMTVPVALGLVALGAAGSWWFIQDEPGVMDSPVAAVVQHTTVAPPATLAVAVPAQTQAAIAVSLARLAEQPAAWFTLDMGTIPVDKPLASFNTLSLDRPLFVVPDKAGRVRVLYGVFATQPAAKQLLERLQQSGLTPDPQAATVITIGSL